MDVFHLCERKGLKDENTLLLRLIIFQGNFRNRMSVEVCCIFKRFPFQKQLLERFLQSGQYCNIGKSSLTIVMIWHLFTH